MSDDPLRPGGALEGRLFRRFLRHLSEVREPESGERIGAWRIVREIGRGGSGVVFLAERDDGAYTQQVALKWLRGDRPVPGGHGVLLRERQLLASLDHPNIARVIDGGETEDGMLWFAMDHVDGTTIDAAADTMELDERLGLVRTLCRAVHHAHRRGLIHGDIKPTNVLVDRRARPRLVDFGISRLSGTGPGSSYGLTPDYASPEQRSGEELTTASDIWQLGRLLQRLVGDEKLPADLRAVITRATARAPEERYASAEALGADIANWLARRPVAAYPGGAAYRLHRLVQRNLLVSMVAGLAAAIIVVGGAWMTLQLAQERDYARDQAQRAEAALAETEVALVRARSLRDFLVGLFRASEAGLPREELPETEALLEQGARRALESEVIPDAERFGMLLTLAEVYMTLGRNDQVEPLLQAGVELAQRHADRRPEDLSRALSLQGYMAMAANEAERAESLFLEAETIADRSPRARDAWVHARTRRAWLSWRMGQVEPALSLLEPVRKLITGDDRNVVQPATRLQALNALASIHHSNGDLEQSLGYREQSVAMARRLNGDESRGHAVALGNLAGLQITLGRFDAAEQSLRRVLELYDRIFDRPVVLRASAYGSLAKLLAFTGRDDEALAALDTSTREWAKAEDKEPEQYAWRDYHFGRMLLRLERPSEARVSLQRAIERFDAKEGPPAHAPMMPRAWLARIECREGDIDSGRALLAEMEAWGEPEITSLRADVLESRAACLLAGGEAEAAIEALERSLELVSWPGYARYRSQRWLLKAEALEQAGRMQEAQRALDRARALGDVAH